MHHSGYKFRKKRPDRIPPKGQIVTTTLFEDPDITAGSVQKGVLLSDSEKQEISSQEGNPS